MPASSTTCRAAASHSTNTTSRRSGTSSRANAGSGSTSSARATWCTLPTRTSSTRCTPRTAARSSSSSTRDPRLARGRSTRAGSTRRPRSRSRWRTWSTDSGRVSGVGLGLAQPVEAGTELLVVDRDLAVEHQGARRELRDSCRDVAEAPSVVAAIPADEAHALAVLVREDPPAVDLLFVHPAIAVERLADERRGHGRVVRQHELPFYLAVRGWPARSQAHRAVTAMLPPDAPCRSSPV